MIYEVIITNTANLDLQNITYNVLNVSKSIDVTLNFIKELKSSLERLSTFPYSGALPKDRFLLSQNYRYVIYKDYLSFYKIDEFNKKVYIETIFNSKLDYTRILKNIL